MSSLTVGIITYNSPGILRRCLETLVAYTSGYDEIFVINNNPEEEYRTAVDEVASYIAHPLNVVHMDKHGKPSHAINASLSLCQTDQLCMVSDDVMFVPGNPFWPSMIGITADPKVGLVGPTIDRGSSPLQLAATVFPCDFLQTNYIMGMMLMARTDVWKEVGGCDEELEGGEEMDLVMYAMKAGYRIIINRQVYIYHEGAATMKKLYDEEAYMARGKRAGEYIIAKHGEDVYFNPVDLPGFPRDENGPAPMTPVDPAHRIAMHVALVYHQGGTKDDASD